MVIIQPNFPQWVALLNEEDFEFIRQFILNSGSLKEMARHYKISYPTVRLRLDRLIQKVSSSPSESDAFIDLVKRLALDGEMSYQVAKMLIGTYKEEKRVVS